jgi:DNA-binding transcriptional ArsR family regulator
VNGQDGQTRPTPGDELLNLLAVLANPHRLRILATLAQGGRHYVSELARTLGISRPLMHMHLRRLEGAKLVSSRLELSDDGKAMRFYALEPFEVSLTAERVVEAARTMTVG